MNITWFLVRLESEHEWDENNRFDMECGVEDLIRKAIGEGLFDSGAVTKVGKNVLYVDVQQTNPPTPRIGSQAARLGFVLEENSFEPGTPKYVRWAKSWYRESSLPWN